MKFRKKPVVIDAFRFRHDVIPDWFMDHVTTNTIIMSDYFCLIHTLEGDMRGDKGDWIIRGVKGEVYPCKDDIFMETYDIFMETCQQPHS